MQNVDTFMGLIPTSPSSKRIPISGKGHIDIIEPKVHLCRSGNVKHSPAPLYVCGPIEAITNLTRGLAFFLALTSSNDIARPVASSIMHGFKMRESKGGRVGCQSISSKNCGMVRLDGTSGRGPPGATISDMVVVGGVGT